MYSGAKKTAADYIPQSDESFESVNQTILTYMEARNWLGNPPRSLAISIALEAAELVEHYQWSDKPVGDKAAIGEELADIFIYAFEFAQANEIDIVEAIKAKLDKAALKYPVEAFKGKTGEAKRQAWLDAKMNHQKEGL